MNHLSLKQNCVLLLTQKSTHYSMSSFSLNLWSHIVFWHAHCPETTRSFLKRDHELTWENMQVILRLERLWCLSWLRWFFSLNTCCSSYCRYCSLVWVKGLQGGGALVSTVFSLCQWYKCFWEGKHWPDCRLMCVCMWWQFFSSNFNHITTIHVSVFLIFLWQKFIEYTVFAGL